MRQNDGRNEDIPTSRGRTPLGPATALALAFAAALGLAPPATRAEPSGAESAATPDHAGTTPNVVLIFCDDLGYGDVPPFGSPRVDLPNLRRLADEGAAFSAFHACANVCTPSRAGLLTGRYPIRFGLETNVLFVTSPGGLPSDEVTLPELLRERGRDTALFGKWHLGRIPEHSPLLHGFDEFLGSPWSNDMSPYPLMRGNEVLEESADQTTLTRRLAEAAAEFVARPRDGRPFFLMLAHPQPHIPLFAHPEFVGKSGLSLYEDVLLELDWSVGRLLEAIGNAGLDESTLVLFTSDNGPWFEGDAGGRGRKGEATEGGDRVPLLARWPGRIPAGARVSLPATNLDLLPTLVELAGGAPLETSLPEGRAIDGRSLVPVLMDPSTPPSAALAERPLLHFVNDQITGVRRGKWKLMLRTYYRGGLANLASNPHVRPGLLFDLEADPGERYGLAREHPEFVAELTAIADRARDEFAASRPVEATRAAPAP